MTRVVYIADGLPDEVLTFLGKLSALTLEFKVDASLMDRCEVDQPGVGLRSRCKPGR